MKSDLDLVALQWLLLFGLAHTGVIGRQLVLVVGVKEADQRVEVVELADVLRVAQLLLVDAHLRVDLRDLRQEILDLLLLAQKLAVLLVVAEDDPD